MTDVTELRLAFDRAGFDEALASTATRWGGTTRRLELEACRVVALGRGRAC